MSIKQTSVQEAPGLYFCSQQDCNSLLEAFLRVRNQTERLCEPLETEDFGLQSMESCSPAKWHLAHTTWFFETFILARFLPDLGSVHPDYAFLFNSYYIQAGERQARPKRGLVSRPTVAEVFDYRKRVDERVVSLLELGAADELDPKPWVEVGIHHEQQHQELILTDLKHAFFQNPLLPAYLPGETPIDNPVPETAFVEFPEGLFEVGHSGQGFCFDNETPRHRCYLRGFELAGRLVTNGEFLVFIEDGGYRRPTLWLSEGWDVRSAEDWQAPLYWVKSGDQWNEFTLAGLRQLQMNEPVCHVSLYEADAYARWAGARLPTEFEWEVAAQSAAADGTFLDSGRFHPAPLSFDSPGPLHQMSGDVWEWTQSAYLGYPRYRPMEGALGEYNGKFMANQFVLRGGSCASPKEHLRHTYRNFFHPQARWQFSGIRLARDA